MRVLAKSVRRFVEFLVVVCAAPLVALVLSVACASEPRPSDAPANERVVAGRRTFEAAPGDPAVPRREPAVAAVLPAWAFTEYRQYWTDTSESIELFADGTYSWKSYGHSAGRRPYEERGSVRLVGGWLELTRDEGHAGERRASVPRGCVARWRERRCFLRERDVVRFANDVNRGLPLGPRFLLAKDSSQSVESELEATLPPEYADYVLAEPVIATVLTAVDRRALGERGDRVEFTLDRGAADGLRVGHELWTLDLPSADEIPWSGRLVEVGEHTARGRMRFTPFVPAVGSRLSTRHPRAP